MDGQLFPETALEILRQTEWNPQAAVSYDGMSGGLVWDDELPAAAIDACTRIDNWAFRFVLGYRASLIRDRPREELRAAWDQLLTKCPDWPGFRPERRSADLRPKLDAEDDRFVSILESMME